MAVSERVGSPRYRFYLQNATGGLLEIDAPDGWNQSKYAIKREVKYWGVTRKISINDLIFLKASRDYVRDVYEGQGINALIIFTVTRLDDTTGGYISYFTGKLDLSTYKIEQIGVHCQVLDTSFAEKVNNRANQKVDIRKRISVEGYEIPAFSNENPQLNLPAYSIKAWGTWTLGADADTSVDLHHVPLQLISSDFDEAQSQPIEGSDPMFNNSTAIRTIRMTGQVSGSVMFSEEVPHSLFRINLNVNGAVDKTWSFTGSFSDEINFGMTIDESFTVNVGGDISLTAQVVSAISAVTSYDLADIEISETLESVTGGYITAYPYYEALLRVLQLITDDNDVMYCTKFGRTDSEVVTYASDGQLGHLTKGLYIRKAEGFNDTIPISFAETFASLSCLFQLGMGIETISGKDKVVIEELQYFFSSSVILDLSARIQEETIGKEVIPTRHFNEINVGYNSYEYLTVGGLSEFNTKSNFSTVISALENKLDLVSKYRADTQGIILLRKNRNTAGGGENDDIKGDEDIFVIDSLRDGSTFLGRTDEGFTSVTGGADAENNLNLMLTPKRNLLRNGDIVRAGLQKNLGTYLRWQSSEKNTRLATQLTTEATPLLENADVLVNDLTEPFFLPEFYTLECVMYTDELEAIKDNPKGLIKIAPLKYGWIWDLEMGNEENKVSLKLLRANLNVITPV